MNEFYSYNPLIQRKRNISVTTYLIIINVAVFLFVFLFGSLFPGLLDYIVLKPSLIIKGQFLWTFLTSMFMHGGIFHLAMNMLTLFFLGDTLERLVGAKKFLIIYFASGLFASLFLTFLYFIFSDPRLILFSIFSSGSLLKTSISVVGASGAIFGVAGALTLLKPRIPVSIMFIPIPMPLYVGVIILLVALSLFPFIANSAHIGGVIAGMLLTYYFFFRNQRVKRLYTIRSGGF